MIRLLSTLFVLTLAGTTNAQDGNSIVDINKLFELKVDSIEQKVTINKWGTDTSYYLHFQVENITIDTLTFKTNTCFYYNHSTLTVGNLEFDLNPKGGCLFNSHNEYELAPNESFDEAQSITAFKLNKLENGDWDATLSVPILQDDDSIFRVDGRGFVENELYLTYSGKVKVMRTVIDNRKRKKKKKST